MEYKKGDTVQYTEDGQIINCEVVEVIKRDGMEGYRLRVIKQLRPHPICIDAEPGAEFEALVSLEFKYMCYGGMWRVHPQGTFA